MRPHRGAPRPRWAACLVAALALLALTGSRAPAPASAAATGWSWDLPENFPTPRVPASNPMSKAKVELGRRLFYDPRLSGNGRQSCSSCHLQEKAFTDGRARAIGSTGELHPRSAPSLTNVAYNATLAWANPSLVTLEKQMEVPLFGDNPVEMGITDANKAKVIRRLMRDPRYRTMFAAAFPTQAKPIGLTNVVKAISSFQRTMISGDSRYDRYLAGRARLTARETRGKDLFFGERAECFHCHTSFNFNDQTVYAGKRVIETPFHNTGLFNVGGTGAFPSPNTGLFELTGLQRDMGRFRAPTLRNVAVTAPYMHDGSIATLQAVVRFYADGGRNITSGPDAGDGRLNPNKSGLIERITLTPRERSDLVAFLKTLTDRTFLTDPALSDPFAPRRASRR